jgi:hypothetical protein
MGRRIKGGLAEVTSSQIESTEHERVKNVDRSRTHPGGTTMLAADNHAALAVMDI